MTMKSTLTTAATRQVRAFGLILLLMLAGLSTVQAGDPPRATTSSAPAIESLRKSLIAALPFPSELASAGAGNQVQLSFMITEDRKLDVIRVEGSNYALNRFVLDQLDGISMTRYGSFIGKMIKIKLSFTPSN
jgi:hypothetical protein